MTPTSSTITEAELRVLYDYELDDPVEDRIETHSGAWIKDGSVWRWYQADGVE